jgi:hypothetical protein
MLKLQQNCATATQAINCHSLNIVCTEYHHIKDRLYFLNLHHNMQVIASHHCFPITFCFWSCLWQVVCEGHVNPSSVLFSSSRKSAFQNLKSSLPPSNFKPLRNLYHMMSHEFHHCSSMSYYASHAWFIYKGTMWYLGGTR